MSLPKKVLHIELGRHLVGGTMQTFYLSQELQKRGIKNLVVTPHNSPLYQRLKQANIPARGVHYSGDLDLLFIPKLIAIVRTFKPDIIHIHSRRGADTLGLIAAKLARLGKVIVARRVDDPLPDNWFTHMRYQYLPDRVIAVSQGIVQSLTNAGIDRDVIDQVYSAIDFSSYQVKADPNTVKQELGITTQNVIAVIGQLIPRKGHRFLIEAAADILKQHPDTSFLFLGEGKEREKLAQQVTQLNLDKNFVFAGYRTDIGRILNAIDILVHPATMEGFANVALQAMAAKIPVVSSAVGGMPESVLHEKTGLLVEPKEPKQIAKAVNQLLSDRNYLKKLGTQGQAFVEQRFTIERTAEETLKVYQTLFN